MKILIVSQYFWPENFSINTIAKYMVSKGHTVDVLTGIPNYPSGKVFEGYGRHKNTRQSYEGVNVFRVPMKVRGEKGGDKRLILNYLSYAINASIAIIGRIKYKYDVIFVYAMSPITQAYPALFLRGLKKIPVCLYVGDLWPDTLFSHGLRDGIIKNVITKKCAKIYRKSDSIIVVNESFKDSVKRYSEGRRIIKYIPQAVEKLYQPLDSDGELRRQLSIRDNDFIIMFAGNVGYAQAVKTVLEAAKRLVDREDIHFVFVGDGSLKAECESICEESRLKNCHFIGRKPQQEMPMIIANADAMLVTLKNQSNYNLTLPGRTQAFMACGKPILCCANGETARVIKESKSGIVCEAENSKALAEGILRFCNMTQDERRQLGLNGLDYSNRNYDMQKMLEQIQEVLRETVYAK